jgi:hypothetical protein
VSAAISVNRVLDEAPALFHGVALGVSQRKARRNLLHQLTNEVIMIYMVRLGSIA